MLGPVLIVEDDDCVRETLREILSDSGFQISCVCNGAEAIVALSCESMRPALILLDLMMPVMDGYEFRARQLADARWRHIPVVVLTAHDDSGRTSERLSAPVLLKPFDIDALYAHLECLGRHEGNHRATCSEWDTKSASD